MNVVRVWHKSFNQILHELSSSKTKKIYINNIYNLLSEGLLFFKEWKSYLENDKIFLYYNLSKETSVFINLILNNTGLYINNNNNCIIGSSLLINNHTLVILDLFIGFFNEVIIPSLNEFKNTIILYNKSLESNNILYNIIKQLENTYNLSINDFINIINSILDYSISNTNNIYIINDLYNIFKDYGWLNIIYLSCIDTYKLLHNITIFPLFPNSESLLISLFENENNKAFKLFIELTQSLVNIISNNKNNITNYISIISFIEGIDNHPEIWNLLDDINNTLFNTNNVYNNLLYLDNYISSCDFLFPDNIKSLQIPKEYIYNISIDKKTLELCEEYKIKGNKLYISKDYSKAIIQYSKALDIYPYYSTIIANIIACNLNLQYYNNVINDCIQYFNYPWQYLFGDNVKKQSIDCKIYYRYASALFEQKEYIKSYIIMKYCLLCDPISDLPLYKKILEYIPSYYNPSLQFYPWINQNIKLNSCENILSLNTWKTFITNNYKEKINILFINDSKTCILSNIINSCNGIIENNENHLKNIEFNITIIEDSINTIGYIIFIILVIKGLLESNISIPILIDIFNSKDISYTIYIIIQNIIKKLIINSENISIFNDTYKWCIFTTNLINNNINIDYILYDLHQYWISLLRNTFIEKQDNNDMISNPYFNNNNNNNNTFIITNTNINHIIKFINTIQKTNISVKDYWDNQTSYIIKTTLEFQCYCYFNPIIKLNNISYDIIYTGYINKSIIGLFNFLRLLINQNHQVIIISIPHYSSIQLWKESFEYQYHISPDYFCLVYNLQYYCDLSNDIIYWKIDNKNSKTLRNDIEDIWDIVTWDCKQLLISKHQIDNSLNTKSYWDLILLLQLQGNKGRNIDLLYSIIDEFLHSLEDCDSIYSLSCINNALVLLNNIDISSLLTSKDAYLLKLFSDNIPIYSFVNWYPQFDIDSNPYSIIIIASILSSQTIYELSGQKLCEYITEKAIGRDLQIIDNISYQQDSNLLSFYFPIQFYNVENEHKPTFILLDINTYTIIAHPLQTFTFQDK